VGAVTSYPDEGDLLTAFEGGESDLQWRVVNDNVMGGRSSGGFTIESGSLRFTGVIDTQGGGFASVRSLPVPFDFGHDTEGFQLRVRGDGRTYTFRAETSEGVSYWADFPGSEEWRVVQVPFSSFKPRYRGRWLQGPALDSSGITSLGLMIVDGRDGPFQLLVDWIGTYRTAN
jgi:hypothetical protein